MSLEAIVTNPYMQLQSVIETARQRNAVGMEKPRVEQKSMRRSQSSGGALFQKSYGKTAVTPTPKAPRVGSRFDIYG